MDRLGGIARTVTYSVRGIASYRVPGCEEGRRVADGRQNLLHYAIKYHALTEHLNYIR